jgi:hypothetical protein
MILTFNQSPTVNLTLNSLLNSDKQPAIANFTLLGSYDLGKIFLQDLPMKNPIKDLKPPSNTK